MLILQLFCITDDENFMVTDGSSILDNSLNSITLPGSLFQQLNDDATGVVFTLYQASALFPVGDSARSGLDFTTTEVGTPIITANVGQAAELNDLQENVTVILQLQSSQARVYR